MSIVYRYVKYIRMSEDLLQETYIQIFRNINSYKTSLGGFNAWSARIAVNTALQYLRKTKDILVDELPEISINEAQHIYDKLTVEEIKETIDDLPEVHRIILNLYYYENFSHEEIASLLGIKKSTSRSQLSRAKNLLVSKWTKLNTSGI